MQEKEIHLRDYWRIIQKRKFVVIVFFLASFSVVALATIATSPQYEATCQILLDRNDMNPIDGNTGLRFDPDFLGTQTQLIKSFNVSRRVVKKLDLAEKYAADLIESQQTSFGANTRKWLNNLFAKDLTANLPTTAEDKINETETVRDTIARMISRNIEVKSVGRTKMLDISYLDANPELAKMVVNAVTEAYMDELLEIKMSTTSYSLNWMTRKAEEERLKLQTSENALKDFMKQNDIVSAEEREGNTPQKLTDINTEFSSIMTERKKWEAIRDKFKEYGTNLEKVESIPLIKASDSFQSISGKMLKAQQYIIELSKKYGPKHPTMISAHNDLKLLEQEKGKEIARLRQSVETEYELAVTKEKNLQKMLEETRKEALILNERFMQYEMLNREVATNRILYDALIRRIKEQSVTEHVQPVNVWIVEKAKTPEFPAKPNVRKNLLLGLMLGLCGSLAMAFFIEYLDNTVQSVEEVERRFGITVLGMVERFTKKDQRIETAVEEEPMSSFAESYKHIRSALLLSSAERPPQKILITSASPGEGKTITSINLARSIAKSNRKVLLIDADLRRPSVHKVLALDNSKGLSSFLAGMDTDVIQSLPTEAMHILPAGPQSPNPSELLGSQKMSALLNHLEKKFDFIIIDSPPIMSVTDSLILSKIAEGTIIVARAGKTTYEALGNSLKVLMDIDAKLLGLVINSVDYKRGHYYYQGYYQYYGPEKEKKTGTHSGNTAG